MNAAQADTGVAAGLRRIRRLRIWMWGELLSFFPLAVVAVGLQPPSWLLTAVGLLWFVSFGVLALVHNFSRCPACRRFFNIRADGYHNVFTRKCLNCGLPLNSDAC
jgi:hypothetical protein